MCGIVAVLARNPAERPVETAHAMTAKLVHRGPDDEGYFSDGPVAFGFRRLAILDLSDHGHQPMLSPDGDVAMVFNGEIFNYIEIRRQLQKLGYQFRSTGDSEVLLNAYLEWGVDCVEKFNGEWAFIIYDARQQRLFGSRDRFGINPLYRVETAGMIAWASEIKALLELPSYKPSVDWDSAADYFLSGEIDHTTSTFFDGIQSIPAGTAFETHLDGSERRWKYWSLPARGVSIDASDPAEQFAELFEDSVALRLRSDVPVAVCLSGGLDSTAIACSMARGISAANGEGAGTRLQAFSYHHDEYDEGPYIKATIEQTGAELNQFTMDEKSLWSRLDTILRCQDEPVHSLTPVVGYELMKAISGAGVRVVLNGQGADEYMAGYDRYFRDAWYSALSRGDIPGAWRNICKFAEFHGGNPRRHFAVLVNHLLRTQLRGLGWYRSLSRSREEGRIREKGWFAGDLIRVRAVRGRRGRDLASVLRRSVEESPLPLYLRVEDRNSMGNSVEARLPWLDYRLLEYAFSLDDSWKIRGAQNKYLLRASMKSRIPENVRSRMDKMGFPVGMPNLMKEAALQALLEQIDTRKARERGVFNVGLVVSELRAKAGQPDRELAYDAFRIAQFEMWADQHGL